MLASRASARRRGERGTSSTSPSVDESDERRTVSAGPGERGGDVTSVDTSDERRAA